MLYHSKMRLNTETWIFLSRSEVLFRVLEHAFTFETLLRTRNRAVVVLPFINWALNLTFFKRLWRTRTLGKVVSLKVRTCYSEDVAQCAWNGRHQDPMRPMCVNLPGNHVHEKPTFPQKVPGDSVNLDHTFSSKCIYSLNYGMFYGASWRRAIARAINRHLNNEAFPVLTREGHIDADLATASVVRRRIPWKSSSIFQRTIRWKNKSANFELSH